MAATVKDKVATLTPDTYKIASGMNNFSAWLRTRLRQYEEGVDLVELEVAKTYLRLQFKTLSEAVHSCFPHTDDFSAEDVFIRFNEMMAQKKLEDFE